MEVLEAHLAQIEKHNPALNAVVTLDTEHAHSRARAADEALAHGEVWGSLHGVPFTVKDAHSTAGMRTTTGFPPLDHVPQEDSTVVARLKAAGGILIGKTNVALMLGDPAQSSNPIFGRTNNPWNVERAPGGSSGGAAAALAAGLTPFEIGAFQPEENSPPITLAQYLAAQHRRDQSILAWEAFFQTWDVLLCPPSMTTAFPHAETGSPLHVDGQEVAYWLVNAHTTLFNYSGHPAIVLPYKLDRDGLPIGVQVVGKRWDESRLLGMARAMSAVTGEFRRPSGY